MYKRALILAIEHKLINIKMLMIIILTNVSIEHSLNVRYCSYISAIQSHKIYLFNERSNFAEFIFMIVDEFIKRITNARLSTQRCTSWNRIPFS